MKKNFKKVVEFPSREIGVEYCINKGIVESDIRDYKKDEVLFYSSRVKTWEAQILSNMYMCKLVYKGLIFNSVEQMYHYFVFTQHPDVQVRIQECRTGFDVKKMCKGLERDGDFMEKKYKVMEACLRLKYIQCKEFREVLEKSGNKPIVEWAEWGDVSAGTCRYIEDGEEWLIGRNSGGRLLMKVRENMKNGDY